MQRVAVAVGRLERRVAANLPGLDGAVDVGSAPACAGSERDARRRRVIVANLYEQLASEAAEAAVDVGEDEALRRVALLEEAADTLEQHRPARLVGTLGAREGGPSPHSSKSVYSCSCGRSDASERRWRRPEVVGPRRHRRVELEVGGAHPALLAVARLCRRRRAAVLGGRGGVVVVVLSGAGGHGRASAPGRRSCETGLWSICRKALCGRRSAPPAITTPPQL